MPCCLLRKVSKCCKTQCFLTTALCEKDTLIIPCFFQSASGAKSPRCRSGRSWTSLSHLVKMFERIKRSPSYLVGLSLKHKNGHLNMAHMLLEAILCCKIRAQGSVKIYPGFYRSVLRFIQFLVPAILSIRNKDMPCFRQVTRAFLI